MSEKYTIVQHEKRLFWLQDCPVLLHSYALTKNNTNNSIFLQCKFENIADKPIKAMNIAVKCSDVSHQELANVDNFPYLDIDVQPYMISAYQENTLSKGFVAGVTPLLRYLPQC